MEYKPGDLVIVNIHATKSNVFLGIVEIAPGNFMKKTLHKGNIVDVGSNTLYTNKDLKRLWSKKNSIVFYDYEILGKVTTRKMSDYPEYLL